MIKLNNSQKLFIGALLIFFSVISSVVAATVTINTNNRVEFGQGLYQVKACDTFISVTAESDGTNMNRVYIDGLDITKCPDTHFRIRFYGTGPTPLNIYQDSGTAVNRLLLYANGSKDLFAGLDFRDARGLIPSPYIDCSSMLQPKCKEDGFLQLDYFEGRYTFYFTTPMAATSAVRSVTVETTRDIPSEVVACNTIIGVSTTESGGKLKEVILDSLDVKNCPGKYIRIRFFDSGNNALALYSETGGSVSRLLLRVKDVANPDLFLDLDFLNRDGIVPNPYQDCSSGLQPNCKGDGNLSLDYLEGRYTLIIETPTATMSNVNRYQVDTSSELPSS